MFEHWNEEFLLPVMTLQMYDSFKEDFRQAHLRAGYVRPCLGETDGISCPECEQYFQDDKFFARVMRPLIRKINSDPELREDSIAASDPFDPREWEKELP